MKQDAEGVESFRTSQSRSECRAEVGAQAQVSNSGGERRVQLARCRLAKF